MRTAQGTVDRALRKPARESIHGFRLKACCLNWDCLRTGCCGAGSFESWTRTVVCRWVPEWRTRAVSIGRCVVAGVGGLARGPRPPATMPDATRDQIS